MRNLIYLLTFQSIIFIKEICPITPADTRTLLPPSPGGSAPIQKYEEPQVDLRAVFSTDQNDSSWYVRNTTSPFLKDHTTGTSKALHQQVTGVGQQDESPMSFSSNENCLLYLAESSIPNAGLGMYSAVPLEKGQILKSGEIVLNIYDLLSNMKIAFGFPTAGDELDEWNKIVKDKEDRNENCLWWAKGGSCDTNPSYMLDMCSKSCAVRNAGLDLDKVMLTQDDREFECTNFALNGECVTNPSYMIPTCPGSCYNIKFGIDSNYIESPFLTKDYYWSPIVTSSEREASEISSIIPGIGSLANSHLGLVNSRLLPPSIGSAGYHRSKDHGVGAFSDRFDANAIIIDNIPAGMELFVDYGSGYFEQREGTMGKMPKLLDYGISEDLLKEFWRKIDKKNGNKREAEKYYKKLLDSVTEDMVKMAMPKTYEEAQSIRHTKAAMLTVPNAIKSQDWLRENGMCLDNIYSGQSEMPQAGRGAFASRNIKAGQFIAPMPLLHMNKSSLRILKNKREFGSQLMLNYVYGHKKSSLVLLPYSPIVNFVNNHSDKSKVNAKIQWSKQHHNKSWEDQTVEYILKQLRTGLMLELVAISDIEKDEEIYIDYGAGWDKAWAEFVENWKPPPRSEEYMSVEKLNAADVVMTETERVKEPLGYNVDTMCIIDTEALVRDIAEHTSELNWADYSVDVDREGIHDSTTVDCFVSNRYLYQQKEEGKRASILYQTYIVGNDQRGEKKIFLNDVPREAIYYANKPYTSDQHIENAFRHIIEIPDEIFPPKWMDLIL